jgi:hypothetical protein
MKWKYKEKTSTQLKNWFYNKPKKNKKFRDFSSFILWYNLNINDKKCYYCSISERQIQKVIHLGLLKSKRFPKNGIFKRGVNRGYWLEIDRKNPKGKYSEENCVPCCYFCNNDKSDVFHGIEYKKFFQNRAGYLLGLIKE